MTDISKAAVERLADSYVVPHLPPDCRPERTAANTLRALRAELDRSEARVATLEGALEGAANWLDATICLIEETDCNPDDEERFDDVMMGANLWLQSARALADERKEGE